jgi:microcystin-dependent protein
MTDLPIGAICPFAGSNLNGLPANWLLCDGRSVSAQDYPQLSVALGGAFGADGAGNFNLPDLRGMFLRGVDGGSGNDPDTLSRTAQASGGNSGDAVGSRQADQLVDHSHALGPGAGYHGQGDYAVYQMGPLQSANATGYTGGLETRPKNVYVHYLIYAGG